MKLTNGNKVKGPYFHVNKIVSTLPRPAIHYQQYRVHHHDSSIVSHPQERATIILRPLTYSATSSKKSYNSVTSTKLPYHEYKLNMKILLIGAIFFTLSTYCKTKGDLKFNTFMEGFFKSFDELKKKQGAGKVEFTITKNFNSSNFKDNIFKTPSDIKKKDNVGKLENAISDDFKDSNFKDDFLNAHNEYRKKHGAGKLEYDSKLNSVAQEWAENLAKMEMLKHKGGNEYGENIFMNYNSNPSVKMTGQDPVSRWYDEVKNYDFSSGRSRGGVIGHFTQVVWKGSKKLGVGAAKSRSNRVYVVANYFPPGNVIGQHNENVLQGS